MRLVPIATVVISLALRQVCGDTINTCDYQADSCGCQTDKGLIDLRHFQSNGLATKGGLGGVTYYWNPCKDITKGSITAACIQHQNPSYDYDCGVHAQLTSTVENGNAVFQMKSQDDVRESRLTCICGSGDTIEFTNEDPMLVYNLQLTSKHCCPGAPSGASGSNGLSGGSILLIVFFCLVIVYLVGGTVVQTGLRGAQGVERIPNSQFWAAVPGLVMEGIKFTISCGKSGGYNNV